MSQEYATRDFNETDVPNLTSAFYHAARDESDEGLDDYSDKEHCRATKKAVRAEQDLSPECLDERLEGSPPPAVEVDKNTLESYRQNLTGTI